MKSSFAGGLALRWTVLCLASLAAPALLSATWVTCYPTICDLGSLGSQGSSASFINDDGDVAGLSDVGSPATAHAFLYDPGDINITDLDPASGSTVTGLNSSGDVSGSEGSTAFFYNGTLTPLGHLSGGFGSLGNDLNDSGTVVGESEASQSEAFSWTSGGGMTAPSALVALGGSPDALLIDNAGDIAGYYTAGSNQSDAFFLSYTGPLVSGITLGGDTNPLAINTSGQVVGSSYLGTQNSGEQHAFLFSYTPGSGGSWSDLGTIGNYDGNSDALAINDSGEVVGESDAAPGVSHAFMYVGAALVDLGTLNGSSGNSIADAVNDNGWIVGTASTGSGTDPFVYINGQMIDLNTPEFLAGTDFSSLTTATGINLAGDIIGVGVTTSGATDAYVLNYAAAAADATPEPSTLASMTLGLLSCALVVLRHRKRSHRNFDCN